MTRFSFALLLSFTSLVYSSNSNAQVTPVRTDSTRRSFPSNGLKAYKDVITSKAVSDEGMISVHKIDEKYYFEIPDSIFNREILTVNRLSKAPAGLRSGSFFGYAGDDIGRNVIRFERGPGNKVFLRTISYAEYAKDSTSPMFTSVTNSNIQPIAAAFDIKSSGKDSNGVVIDVTDYINSDNEVLHFMPSLKSSLRLMALQSDKSYVVSVRAFPINVEIKAVKTYNRSSAPGASGGGTMTMEINSSLVLLPRVPMQARYADPRVGYYTTSYTDFDANPQGIRSVSMISRWRLEPKEGDMEKYKRGELVEPRKPIIFYIDPATPEKWVPYLIQGVNDWQVAFEKAGFKNAIMAKRAPTYAEDSTWSLDDATHSAIVYKPSDIPNAMGPHVADPRSGEIIESHINWYHNVMSLLRNWYLVQTAAVDTAARHATFSDELMGQLIRFVSSHEVGHTLGMPHNFGSSSSVPVEKLRDKAWVEANGHTPSIMDYARFNYVAQPEDNISQAGLFPRIGDYDKWAIEWGYRLFPEFKSPVEEKAKLNQWVIEKLKDKRLWFGNESNDDDPRSQREQVGDDPMKAGVYGIKNLQRILPNLESWVKEPNENYSNLSTLYGQVTGQFGFYMAHVAKFVGGVMETPKTVEQSGPVYEYVSKAKQKEAVNFLNKYLFTTPTWLLDQNIFSKTGINGLLRIGNLQDNTMNRLFSYRTMNRLVEAEAALGAANSYTLIEMLNDVKKGVWGEIALRKPVDVYRRNLQKAYVNALIGLVSGSPTTTTIGTITFTSVTINDKSDIKSAIRGHLAALRSELNAATMSITDLMTKYHLQDLVARIDNLLKAKD